MSFDRDQVALKAAGLAARGVWVGTSSWKYEGWLGQLYDRQRYTYRGRFAKSRFTNHCLGEYARTFKTVCVDAAYYAFPTRDSLQTLAAQVPADFLFGFKVTDAITLKRFPRLERFGPRAGRSNPDFLNTDRFCELFLEPCDSIRSQIGILMFEFSRFRPADYARGREFIADLDGFLGGLPQGWPYGVEIRNAGWLQDEYFECLARHRVAHVYNSWEAMPSVGEQQALPLSRTHPRLAAARFLLKPGRRYEEAVASLQPYASVREINREARAAGAALIREGALQPDRRTFVFVNNRLEGNAPATIGAMINEAESECSGSQRSFQGC
jgi:uncharacterized protein YecE (DUF72 family)